MKIAVFSDSHGDVDSMRTLIETIEPEAVFYLGDGINDILKLEKEFPELRFEYVKGNCDTSSTIPKTKRVEAGRYVFYITHGDIYNSKLETDAVIDVAKQNGAAMFLHGHTHTPTLWTYSGVTVMNPGSVRRKPGVKPPSFGLIRVYESFFVCKILFNTQVQYIPEFDMWINS